MIYKAAFQVSFRGPDPESGEIKDRTNRHSLEFEAPTDKAAYEEAMDDHGGTRVLLRSAYMGNTNVEIELLGLDRLKPVDISAFRSTISIV